MEVRTRRSAGISGGPLNPAMISLLPLQRLKDELQNRGLDIRGNKDDLAMRLEDYIRFSEGGRQVYDPSPLSINKIDSESPKKNKRGYKRKQPADDIHDIENTECPQPDIQKLPQKLPATEIPAPLPFKFNWAKEKPSIAQPKIIVSEVSEFTSEASTCAPIAEQANSQNETTITAPTCAPIVESSEQTNSQNETTITTPIVETSEQAKSQNENTTTASTCSPIVESSEQSKSQKENTTTVSTCSPIVDVSEQSKSLKENSIEKIVKKRTESHLEKKKKLFKKQQSQNKCPEQIEKRRSTLASGEDISIKVKPTISKIERDAPIKVKHTLIPPIRRETSIKVKPTSIPTISEPIMNQQVVNSLPVSDILDSILDKQEQLFTRRTATLGMGKSFTELANENSTDDEEVNELLELELKKRKHRMSQVSGLSTTGTIIGSAQSSQTPVSTSATIVTYSENSKLQTSNNSPLLETLECSPQHVNFKSPHLPLLSPPPPPPKKPTTNVDKERLYPQPLVIDRRDPLGLSLIGPDTPPPPPPLALRPTTITTTTISSFLPPPPPPPPRIVLQTEEKQKKIVEQPLSPNIVVESEEKDENCFESSPTSSALLQVEEDEEKSCEPSPSPTMVVQAEEEEDGERSLEDGEVDDEEDDDVIEDDFSHLLKDPQALLHKASAVLRRKFGPDDTSETEPSAHYEQVALSAEELKIEEEDEEYRQLPDPEQFHGEPVPDDMDDDLFEIAAGLPLRTKKKDKEPELIIEEEPLPNEEQIELDFYNSDLNMKASSSNNWLIDPDNADGFALMWGGVRANYGIFVPEHRDDMPPLAFQVKIAELLSLKHLPFEEPDAHDIRLGWSRMGTSNMLGESPYSFAFNSMANKATGNVFQDYGEPFGIGDVITAVLDINCGEIRFFKNSQNLGPAFTDIQFQTGDVFFPHIATKNCKVYVYFGNEIPDQPSTANNTNEPVERDEELNQWGLPPDEVPEGTKWIGKIDLRMLSPSNRPISDKSHCTIIAMVGLSGVGKTSWVRQYLKEHPEENWVLLNNDTILQAMAVNGVPRQRVHQGRWDMVMGLTAKALNRSLQMACRRRHNYILDQTNVTRDARKRKLTQFQDFQRKCVVIIPSEAEHERRLIRQAREQGGVGQMPAEAMLEMKGNFSIPSTDLEPIEDVIFIEPPIERLNEAIEQVARYNEEGQPWVRQQQQRFNRYRAPQQSIISDHSNIPFVGVTRIGV